MHKPSIILILIVVYFSCSCSTNNKNIKKEGIPKFGVVVENHNFGELESGEVITYSFKYYNAGNGGLKIDSVYTDCGCIEISNPPTPLASGDSAYINVTLNTSGEWGNIWKIAVIYTNDSIGRYNLYITAKVNNKLFK